MAQQTFSGVPGDFTAGQVLTAADMDLLREFLLYLIKDGDETDTGEVSPLILDLGNDRVGIGTDSPSGALDVEDATNAYIYLNDSGGTVGTHTNSQLIFEADGSKAGVVGFVGTTSGLMRLENADGPIYIETESADNIYLRTTGATAMTITSGGDVEIPDDGELRIGSGDDLKLYHDGSNSYIDHNGAGTLYLRTVGSGEDLYLQSEDYFYIQTDGANSRLKISPAGLVTIVGALVGTDFPGTDGMLNVYGNSTTRGIQVYQPTDVTTAAQIRGFSDVGGTQESTFIIESNGDFQSATNSYGAISDERLKTTEPCRDYLDDLLALDVVNFQFTKRFVPTQVPKLDAEGNQMYEQVPVLDADGNPTYTQIEYLDDEGNTAYRDGEQVFTDGAALTQDHETEGEFVDRDPADYSPKQLGVVAQQVEQHIPGLIKHDDYGVKAMKYSVLVPMLLQAVQTLTARIEALEA